MSNEYRDRLEDLGVDPDAVDGLITQRLAQAAQVAGLAQRIEKSYPEIGSQQFQTFVQSDPELRASVARMGEADPAGAIEYAALRFRAQSGSSGRQSPNSQTWRGPNPRQQEPIYGDPVAEAKAEYDRTGSRQAAVRYAKARLRTVIPDDFLNA